MKTDPRFGRIARWEDWRTFVVGPNRGTSASTMFDCILLENVLVDGRVYREMGAVVTGNFTSDSAWSIRAEDQDED